MSHPSSPLVPGESPPQGRVLLLGYGSDLRGDDALGRALAQAVAGWPGVRAVSVHQLTPELAMELQDCSHVVFADASASGQKATLEPLSPRAFRPDAHHASPGGLLELGRHLHGQVPEAWLLAMPGEDFSLREGLSLRGEASLSQALELLTAFLRRTS